MNQTLSQLVEDYLDRAELAFFKNSEGPLLFGRYFSNALLHTLVRIDEDRCYVSADVFAGIGVPEARRSEAAEWVVRINRRLYHGRFEFDVDQGDVSYSNGLFLGETAPDDFMLEALIDGGCQAFNRFLPSLMSVAYGGRSAKDAVEDLDFLPKSPSDVAFEEMMERMVANDQPETPEEA
jgi:hypothetical protein